MSLRKAAPRTDELITYPLALKMGIRQRNALEAHAAKGCLHKEQLAPCQEIEAEGEAGSDAFCDQHLQPEEMDAQVDHANVDRKPKDARSP